MVHVTVDAMSWSTQLSGSGNHALVRWSKRTPCMRMRDGLRVALLAGCSACAVRVSCAWRVSFLSPQLLAFVRLDICSMPVFRCHGLYTWATHVIFMSYTWHTRVIYMSATCHTSVAYTEYTVYIQAHRQCTTDTHGIDTTSEWVNVHMPYMLHTSDT